MRKRGTCFVFIPFVLVSSAPCHRVRRRLAFARSRQPLLVEEGEAIDEKDDKGACEEEREEERRGGMKKKKEIFSGTILDLLSPRASRSVKG